MNATGIILCKHCMSVKQNEIGEVVAFCDEWGCWKNVTLGDCFNNCEQQEKEGDT